MNAEEDKTTEVMAERPEKPVKYVGINARMFACTIDSFMLLAFLYVFTPLLRPLFDFAYSLVGFNPYNPAMLEELAQAQGSELVFSVMAKYKVHLKFIAESVTLYVLYGIIILPMWFKFGKTPGKLIIRARIADSETLQTPVRIKYILRYLGYLVSVAPFMIGILLGAFSKRKQTWHDTLSGTVVVFEKEPWKFLSFIPRPEFKNIIGMYKDMINKVKSGGK